MWQLWRWRSALERQLPESKEMSLDAGGCHA